jgi:uncharacterized iron-regulated membrane protein
VRVHRYAGLTIAVVLVVVALTGCVLAFNQELGVWLDPPPACPEAGGRAGLDPLALRERALALEPHGTINQIPLHREPGEAFVARFTAQTDPATGQPFELGITTAWLDPYTGGLLEKRKDPEGTWPVTRRNLIGFIAELHYSLAGGQIGTWAFGIAALIWTFDSFIGMYLTFPARRRTGSAPSVASVATRPWLARWKVSWLVSWRAGAWRLNFDLHRAFGLWTWLLILVFAWSGVGFNLQEQVYMPVTRALFGWEDPYLAIPKPPQPRPEPGLSWVQARETGRRLLAERIAPIGARVEHEESIYYDPEKALFGYAARTDREIMSRASGTVVLFDAWTGAFLGLYLPTGQGAGATFHNWIFAIHMGTVFGLAGELLVLVMGLVTTMLSVTGIYLWWKKRSSRRRAATAS